MQKVEYYYDLKDVYNGCVAYRQKATSAGITAAGYVPSVTVMSSVTNAYNSDWEEVIGKVVPEDVCVNLDSNGVYNTPTDQSWLTSNLSTNVTKKARTH